MKVSAAAIPIISRKFQQRKYRSYQESFSSGNTNRIMKLSAAAIQMSQESFSSSNADITKISVTAV
jgi:hypothetical protein